MANNSIVTTTVAPAVSVPIADVDGTASSEEKRRKKVQVRAEEPDSIEILKTSSVAGAAEGRSPGSVDKTAHQKIQQARSLLEAALKKAGVDVSGKDISSLSEAELTSLEAEIEKKKSEHADPGEIEALEEKRDNLKAAYEAFQAAHLTEEAPVVLQTASGAAGMDARTAQEQLDRLWKQFGNELKETGLDLSPGERNVETIQKKLLAHFATEVTKIKENEAGLEAKLTNLQEKLKTALPEEKPNLEAQIKAVKEELTQLNLKGRDLQQSFKNLQTTADSILRLEAEQDLNGAKTVERRTTIKAQSAASHGTALATAREGSQAASGDIRKGSPSTSATNEKVSAITVEEESGGEGGPLLGTAAAGAAPAAGPLLDTTGTTMSIQSAGMSLKAAARTTDKALKKLLAAIKSGNVDAISTALLLLSKRSGQILAGMGAQVVGVMALYQKQQGALQATLGKLDPKAADYNAKMTNISIDLQKGNADRQTFAEFLRTAADLREEVTNFTHGYITKMGQISSALARFQ